MDWDDKQTGMVCLMILGVVSLLVLTRVPVEMLERVLTALLPLWTAIVAAIAGAVTGRRGEER